MKSGPSHVKLDCHDSQPFQLKEFPLASLRLSGYEF